MNELNISAVDATAMETAATTSAPKHKWLSKLTRGAKKATMFCTIAGVMASACATQAFAAGRVLLILLLSFLLRVPFSRALSA